MGTADTLTPTHVDAGARGLGWLDAARTDPSDVQDHAIDWLLNVGDGELTGGSDDRPVVRGLASTLRVERRGTQDEGTFGPLLSLREKRLAAKDGLNRRLPCGVPLTLKRGSL